MNRIAITGSSGYLGRKLVAAFRESGCTVLGIDVNPTDVDAPDIFHAGDVRDENLLDVFRDFGADTIVHAAFVIKQLKSGMKMSDINVGGTRNILRITEALKPDRFLFFSSATAMGPWADNPVPIPDAAQPRPRACYQYGSEKAELEKDMANLAERCPETAVSWVRPAIVGGPAVDNFLSKFIFRYPVMIKLDNVDHRLQFVHEDDVVGAVQAILNANGRGPFNLGPPNHCTVSEIAEHTKRRVFSFSFRLAYGLAWLAWNTPFWICDAPPGFLYFARYPWVVSPDRLMSEIGYEFKFTSSETVIETHQHL